MSYDLSELIPHGAVIRAPLYAYKYRHLIQQYWVKAQIFAKFGKTNVVVTGTAGAGKSVFISKLHGELNERDWAEPDASTSVETKPIAFDAWTKVVTVIPGQDSSDKQHGIDEAFNSHDELEGVIHVVDWGHTTIRSSVAKQKMYDQGITTLESYREHNLKIELDEFKQICALINTAITNKRGPKWIVIAVNKIDLFFDSVELAKKYYHPDGDSEFSLTFRKLLSQIGENNLKIAVLPVCSFRVNLDWFGNVVYSNLNNTKMEQSFLRRFFEVISYAAKG